MPVKIRLMRLGAKKRPFYRVVAVDERKKRTGQYLEVLGTYNPLTEPKEIILKKDRIEHWIKNGAVLSDGYLRITKQAPQKPPRKPKKEKEVKAPVEEKPVEKTVEVADQEVAETPSEEVVTEAPAEVESETVVQEKKESEAESPEEASDKATE